MNGMEKITEVLYGEFPLLVTKGGQTDKEWLELNHWEYVSGEGDEAVFTCPLTGDNHIVAHALQRQETRPIEDQVVLLIKRLKSEVEGESLTPDEQDEMVAKIGALQTAIDNLKIANSDLTVQADSLKRKVDEVSQERDSTRAALEVANSELLSLRAAASPPPTP